MFGLPGGPGRRIPTRTGSPHLYIIYLLVARQPRINLSNLMEKVPPRRPQRHRRRRICNQPPTSS